MKTDSACIPNITESCIEYRYVNALLISCFSSTMLIIIFSHKHQHAVCTCFYHYRYKPCHKNVFPVTDRMSGSNKTKKINKKVYCL